jgi:hypothetical protein
MEYVFFILITIFIVYILFKRKPAIPVLPEEPKIYYTISGKTDGFGAQYHAMMSGIALCENKKYVYIHTPFKQMEHGVNIEKLNEFIGIKGETAPCTIKEEWSREVHDSLTPSIYYTDKVIKIIRDAYYSTPKPKISAGIDIAIHIRRGDVSNRKNAERFTSNTEYAQIIRSLKLLYPSYNILIFSEGDVADFADLNLDSSYFRLNTDVMETFHSLVSAKVLVIAKSSFSYAAAILNKNIIYYADFWHKPFVHWLDIKTLKE